MILIHHPLSFLNIESFPSVNLRVDVMGSNVGHILGKTFIKPHLVPPKNTILRVPWMAQLTADHLPVKSDNVAEPLVGKFMGNHIENPEP